MRGSVTVLVDNVARRPGVRSEHGISMFVEVDGYPILFDAGLTDLLIHNARALKVDITRLGDGGAIVLSHSHLDHTGGLHAVMALLKNSKKPPTIYAHGDVFGRLQSYKGQDEWMSAKLSLGIEPRTIVPGVMVTGEIPRRIGPSEDYMKDDQALIINAPEGLIICSGCAHSGIINTIQYASELFDGVPVHSIIGGFHLTGASAEKMDSIVKIFNQKKLKFIYAGHCTGSNAMKVFAESFRGKFKILEVGTRVDFGK